MRIPPEAPNYLLWFYAGCLVGAIVERYFM